MLVCVCVCVCVCVFVCVCACLCVCLFTMRTMQTTTMQLQTMLRANDANFMKYTVLGAVILDEQNINTGKIVLVIHTGYERVRLNTKRTLNNITKQHRGDGRLIPRSEER